MPVRFDQGTGPGVVGDAPQLQYIDPNSTQVQYTAPTPMGLDTAQAAMQKLYGPGQDYSDALSQIQALQGRIKPAGDWGSDLMNFGARFAGGQNLGQAASGVMTDNRSINQQNLTNALALMNTKRAIQAEQQRRADEIAGKSDSYAQQQTQDGINAAKTQYDVDKNNTAGRIGAIEHNNSTAQTQQGLDLRQNAAMADLGQVNAMKQQALNAANAATDPAAKAAAMQKYSQLDAASKQIVAQQQQELAMKTAEQMKVQNNANANAVKLEGMREANTLKLMGGLAGKTADQIDWANDPDAKYAMAQAQNDLTRGTIQNAPGRNNPVANKQFALYKLAMGKLLGEGSLNGADIAGNHASYTANSSGMRTVANQGATINASLNALQAQQPMIMDYVNKLKQSGIPMLDAPTLKARDAAGDANAHALINFAHTYGQEYARMNGGRGGATDALRATGEKMFYAGLNSGQWGGAFDVTDKEGATRTNGFQNTQNSLQSKISGRPFTPAVTQSSYPTTATGPGGHKIGSKDGGQTWFDVQTGKQVQ